VRTAALIGQAASGGSDAALPGELKAEPLGHGRPGAGPNRPLLDRAGSGGLAGQIPGLGAGPAAGLADPQVEDHGSGNDGNPEAADLEADPPLFEPAHHPVHGREAEG